MSRASIFRRRSSLNFSCTCTTRRYTISTLHIFFLLSSCTTRQYIICTLPIVLCYLVGQNVSISLAHCCAIFLCYLVAQHTSISLDCAYNFTCPIRRSVPCMSSWCWEKPNLQVPTYWQSELYLKFVVLSILVPHLCHTCLDPSDFSKLGIQGCLAHSQN